MNPHQIYRQVFGDNKNFMTPYTIWIKQIGNYVIELSYGEGFARKPGGIRPPLWGITVVELVDGQAIHRRDLGQSFPDREEAEGYAQQLGKGV